MVGRFSGNWILSYLVRVSNLVQDHSFQRSHERREPQRLKRSGFQIHRGTWNLQCRVLKPAVKLCWSSDLTKIFKQYRTSSRKGCNLYHWTNHDPISLKTLIALTWITPRWLNLSELCKNVGDNVLDLLGSYCHFMAKNPSSVGVGSSLPINYNRPPFL